MLVLVFFFGFPALLQWNSCIVRSAPERQFPLRMLKPDSHE
uniref:Uncharacterized protein n=1 Tax=Arundo donax TaxID=35708 RepID=A0A0A9ESL0_ARUDO